MENNLMVGYARVNATPMLGIRVKGYFRTRLAEAVLDDIEICALALACGDVKMVVLTMDISSFFTDVADDLRKHIAEVNNLPLEAVYLHATHTHTGPYLMRDSQEVLEQEYYRIVYHKMADVAKFALEDLKPAKMGYAPGVAPAVSFVRRYKMKDGTTRTNPGIGNPDIDHPIGTPDHRVNLLRFNREDGSTVILGNYGNHPDTISGNKISADWPAFVRRQVEQAIPESKCIFFNGAQGDVNHWNVRPDFPTEELMFEVGDMQRGHRFSQSVARAISGTILQQFDRARYVPVDSIRIKQSLIRLPSNRPTPEEMPEAHRIHDLHLAGRSDELPYTGMMLTTVVADASRKVRLEHGPDFYEMTLTGVALGSIALLGIPGEPFTGIGVGLKKAPGWDLVLPTCLTNGTNGYFPMQEAYDEGGYEAKVSRFKAGVAEYIISEGTKLLNELLKK